MPNTNRTGVTFDRVAATCAALVIMGLAVFLLVRNEPIASAELFFTLRVVLSFATATLGATIPGFLEVGWSAGGLAIRAGGALALFVITFLYTPDVLARQHAGRSISAPGGIAADVIKGSTVGNTITQNQQDSTACSQQIVGNYGQINVTCADKKQPNIAELRVIDAYLEGGILNVKLQNSGQGSAFLYELRFLVYPGYGVFSVCMPVFYTVVAFPFNAKYRDQYLSLLNKKDSNVPDDLKEIPSTLRHYMHDQDSISPTRSTSEESTSAEAKEGSTKPVPIFLSPPLKLSEQVKPGDVEWLKIKIESDARHGSHPPGTCGWVEVYDAHVVVNYDDGKRILTPMIQLEFGRDR